MVNYLFKKKFCDNFLQLEAYIRYNTVHNIYMLGVKGPETIMLVKIPTLVSYVSLNDMSG